MIKSNFSSIFFFKTGKLIQTLVKKSLKRAFKGRAKHRLKRKLKGKEYMITDHSPRLIGKQKGSDHELAEWHEVKKYKRIQIRRFQVKLINGPHTSYNFLIQIFRKTCFFTTTFGLSSQKTPFFLILSLAQTFVFCFVFLLRLLFFI